MKIQLQLVILLGLVFNSYAIDNGLGLTPQMGWNSWNHYACDGLNQEVVKQTAQAIVDLGFDKLGYEYVNLDDCWQIARDEKTHEIIADPETFPDGIPALVEFVHGLGLKFGLYSDAGTETCAGRPGSLGYEEIDAQTYAKWGVDYLKYDNCHNLGLPVKERYQAMATALQNVDRPIFFSLCEWGHKSPWKWAPEMGNSWRTTPDIMDKWFSVKQIINLQANLYPYAGPGAWNDPDMLEVGNGGMTNEQYQVQFAFWALLKAPLLIGCDMTNMDNGTKKILGNSDIIAVNQDSLGKQGFRLVNENNDKQIWGIPQADKSTVIILWNQAKEAQDISVTFEFLKEQFEAIDYPCYLEQQAQVRDLVAQSDLGKQKNLVQAIIEPQEIVMYKLTPVGDSIKFLE